MSTLSQPLVSIVTPVYNGAEYIAECIESILAQTYQNWNYVIVDNSSTDETAAIAHSYAARDARIQVSTNQQFVRAVPNFNNALRQISPNSKYTKIVFADDWIFPECLDRMVTVAEQHPSVGIVGVYSMQDKDVMWTGLPYPSTCVSGRDVCRLLLLDHVYVFGTATSVLYRSDLVRLHDPFYNEGNLHSDTESCFVLLKNCDFGFVHQVLAYKRERPESLGALSDDIRTLIAGHLHNLVAHGRDFLTPEEYSFCYRRIVAEYYNFLAVSLLRGRRDSKFWDFHKRKLTDEGVGFSRVRLAASVVKRTLRAIFNPSETLDKTFKPNVLHADKAVRLDAPKDAVRSKAIDSERRRFDYETRAISELNGKR